MQAVDMHFVPFSVLFILLIGLCVAGLVALVLVLMSRPRSAPPPAAPALPERPAPTAEEARKRRTDILEQLAANQLSKEDAEAQLLALGDPVPTPSVPPSIPRNSGGRGCLTALLIGLLIVLVLGALLILGGLLGFAHQPSPRLLMHQQMHHAQQQVHRQMQQTHQQMQRMHNHMQEIVVHPLEEE